MDAKRVVYELFKDKWKDFKTTMRDLSKPSRLIICLIPLNILLIFLNSSTSIIFRSVYFEDDVVWTTIVSEIAITILTGFCCYFGLDALLEENEFQYAGYLVYNTILTLTMLVLQATRVTASIYEIINDHTAQQQIEYKLRGLIAGFIIFIIPFSFQVITLLVSLCSASVVFKSFGWKIFRSCGANIQLQKYYRVYLIYVTMLKVDFAITITTVFVFLGFVDKLAIHSYICNFYALFVCCVLTPLSVYLGTKKENYIIQLGYIFLSALYPVYVLYYVIHTFVQPFMFNASDSDFGFIVQIEGPYLQGVVTYVGILLIVVRVITLFLSVLVMINFRRGLKEIFDNTKVHQTEHFAMNTIEQLLRDVSDADT